MRPTVLLAALALAPLACKKSGAENIVYSVSSKDLSLIGATIDIGTRQEAFTAKNKGTSQPEAGLLFNVPAATPPFLDRLAVSLLTPCGPSQVKLTADITLAQEASGRERGSVFMKVTPATPLPAGRIVWVDGAPGQVTVGQAKLATGRNVVYDASCGGAEPQVAVDGKPVGALPAGTSSVFVSAKPGTCYQYAQVVYSKRSGGGGFSKVLAGAELHELPAPEIQYFLRRASGSSNVEHAAYELVATRCP